MLAAAKVELQRLREVPPPPPDPRLDELRNELTLLRTQNKCKLFALPYPTLKPERERVAKRQ